MSKLYQLILGFFLLISPPVFCQQYINKDEVLDKESMLELIDFELKTMHLIMKFHDNMLSIESALPAEFDKNNMYNFKEEIKYYDYTDELLYEYLDSLSVWQKAISFNILLSIIQPEALNSPKWIHLKRKNDFKPFDVRLIKYKRNNQVYNFKDEDFIKSESNDAQYENEDSTEYYHSDIFYYYLDNKSTFILKDFNPIDSIQIKFDTKIYKNVVYTINKDGTASNPNAKVKLISATQDKVILRYPKNLQENIEIQGQYEDGRYLIAKAYHEHSIMSDQEKAYFFKRIEALKKAKKKAKRKKIKTINQLQEFVSIHAPQPPELDEEVIYIEREMTFSGPFSRIKIRYDGEEIKHFSHTKMYPLKGLEHSDSWITYDLEAEAYGLMGNNGEYIIPPTFRNKFDRINDYYIRELSPNGDRIHYFNQKEEIVALIDYTIEENGFIHEGGYMKISSDYSDDIGYGILHVPTNSSVLYPGFEEVEHVEGRKWKFKNFHSQKFKQVELSKDWENSPMVLEPPPPPVLAPIRMVTPIPIICP